MGEIELFARFLKDRNSYHKFRRNYKKSINLYTFFCNTNPKEYIMCAFAWYATEEKSTFWVRLDGYWRDYLAKHETKKNKYA